APWTSVRPMLGGPTPMAHESTLDTTGSDERSRRAAKREEGHALVVLWSPREPQRIGEVLWMPPSGAARTYRVGGDREQDAAGASKPPRLGFPRQRPGITERAAPVDNPFLSREQLLVHCEDGGLTLENVGKRRLVGEDGEPADAELPMEPG